MRHNLWRWRVIIWCLGDCAIVERDCKPCSSLLLLPLTKLIWVQNKGQVKRTATCEVFGVERFIQSFSFGFNPVLVFQFKKDPNPFSVSELDPVWNTLQSNNRQVGTIQFARHTTKTETYLSFFTITTTSSPTTSPKPICRHQTSLDEALAFLPGCPFHQTLPHFTGIYLIYNLSIHNCLLSHCKIVHYHKDGSNDMQFDSCHGFLYVDDHSYTSEGRKCVNV